MIRNIACVPGVLLVIAWGAGPAHAQTPAPARAPLAIVAEHIVEEGPNYAIKVTWPRTGLAAADRKVKQLIDPMIADVKRDSQLDTSSRAKYEVQASFTTSLAGPDLLSIRLLLYTYTGGAHGSTQIYGLNVDVASGRELNLDDALAMLGLTLPELADRAAAQLRTKLGDEMIFPEGAKPTRDNYSTFVIGRDQVTFVFQQYQVAPYAAGIAEVSLPRKSR